MPFKLPFSKTRHYNVVSRSVLVVCVELLDASTLECTLSADCTGQHCLQNVAQRIGLGQPEFFGLRYMSKRPYPKVRWVELERPLKKQLDKYAQSPALTLSVLYYIHDVGLLQDDTTRSHFFLQVKQDVLDGKLRCNYEQAVLLASYSLQAEFGDHQPDRHTPDYLKDFLVLPKLPSLSEPELAVLLELAVWQYASLRGLAQALAETYYILEAQRLQGYGQETFMARDERGSEVYLGASLVGVTVRPASGHPVTTLRWNDISNLVNLKRAFGIECPKSERTFQFTFDEPDAAKYIWKMCVKQHTFFKRNQELLEKSLNEASHHVANINGEGGEEAGRGKVSVRSLTIPDLQRSVMNAPTAPTSVQQQQLLDRDIQLSYQRSLRLQDPHLLQQQQSYLPVSNSNGGSESQQLYDHLVSSNLQGGCSVVSGYPSNGGASSGPIPPYGSNYPPSRTSNASSTLQEFASSNGFLAAKHNGNNGGNGTTNNNNANTSLLQHRHNLSNGLALNDTSLSTNMDASAVRIHRLDATNLSLYPELLSPDQSLQQSILTRAGPGDLSSLHLQQQQQLMLYNSNPNLTTVSNFSNSFRKTMLPEYRPAPDYHSVMQSAQKTAACGESRLAGKLDTNTNRGTTTITIGEGGYPLHNTYSTPDLQTACSVEMQTPVTVQPRRMGVREQQEALLRGYYGGGSGGRGEPSPPHPHPLHGYRPPPPYPGGGNGLQTPPYTKSTSTSSPDLVASGSAQYQGEGIAQLGGSWSHLASPLNPFARDVQHNGPPCGRGLSRTYENLRDLDDVVVSLRQHMNGGSGGGPQFLHSFSSLSALTSNSLDCLAEGPAVYRLPGHTASPTRCEPSQQQVSNDHEDTSEPIYQNVVAFTQQQQQRQHMLFYQEQLQKQQQLLEHQEMLQKQITGQQQSSLSQHGRVTASVVQQQPLQGSAAASTEANNLLLQQQKRLQSGPQKVERKKWGSISGNLASDYEQAALAISNDQVVATNPGGPHRSTLASHPLLAQYSRESEALGSQQGQLTAMLGANNPLSSSVDSTKSSPVMSSMDGVGGGREGGQMGGSGQLRASESLGALATQPIGTSLATFDETGGMKPTPTYTGVTATTVSSSPNIQPAPARHDAANGVNSVTPVAAKRSLASRTPVAHPHVVIGSPNVASTSQRLSTAAKTHDSKSNTTLSSPSKKHPIKDNAHKDGKSVASGDHRPHRHNSSDSVAQVAAGCSASTPVNDVGNAARDAAVLSRIYATRDPRARQLQNELLSAELPGKFRGTALAQLNATYASDPNGHSVSNGASHCDDPQLNKHHPVWHTLPYIDNRVILQPTAENKQGFVNASNITASIGRSRQVFYMVQAVPPDCADAVWRCVWEHDIRLVVLLARCPGPMPTESTTKSKPSKTSRLLSSFSKKRNKKSQLQQQTCDEGGDGDCGGDGPTDTQHDPLNSGLCFPYWPQFDNTSIECGAYRIHRRDSTQGDGYTISRLQMVQRHHGAGGSRTVWHLHYRHGLTNTRTFIELVEQLSSLREVSQREASEDSSTAGINVNTPVLVQCPVGSEHCGALMLCDLMVGGACDAAPPTSRDNTLRGGFTRDAITDATLSLRGEGSIMDPAKILPHLRQQRANLLPTYDIFQFVYRVMIEYFGRSRLI